MEEQRIKPRFDRHDSILWIMLVTVVWYVIIFSIPGSYFFDDGFTPFRWLMERIHYMPDGTKFAVSMYLATLPAFIGAFLYTGIPKRNRFILRTFLPSHPGNTVRILLLGLLVGFVMNFACILCALLHGDIKLYLDFGLTQIPFFLFALVCVFIQSTSEELWTRGFMYERVNVRYPLWVAILVNGIFFGFLHILNPGVGFLPILDICICGVAFSLAKWYTGSIWFPMGIHTAWNFTQNFLFGLPNSGLVSEASVFKLDAANAVDTLIYSVPFGVEGAVPAVAADGILAIVCLALAAKDGRLKELTQVKGQPPELAALQEKRVAEEAGTWRFVTAEELDARRMPQGLRSEMPEELAKETAERPGAVTAEPSGSGTPEAPRAELGETPEKYAAEALTKETAEGTATGTAGASAKETVEGLRAELEETPEKYAAEALTKETAETGETVEESRINA